MGINVNYYDQVVYITSPTTTVSVQQIYDAMRAAEDTPDGLASGGPVKSVEDGFVDGEGEAALGGSFQTPLTITFDANWYIEFWNGVGLGTVNDGNIAGGKDNKPVRCASGSSDTALVLGAERGILVSVGSGLTSEEHDKLMGLINGLTTAQETLLDELHKTAKNKKVLSKTGSTWELIIYDDDDTTPIFKKEIKDKDGNDIEDLEIGVLAQELASSV